MANPTVVEALVTADGLRRAAKAQRTKAMDTLVDLLLERARLRDLLARAQRHVEDTDLLDEIETELLSGERKDRRESSGGVRHRNNRHHRRVGD